MPRGRGIGAGFITQLETAMRLGVRAALAAALLYCVLPQALADDEAHWLIDPYTHCALFDANASIAPTRQADAASALPSRPINIEGNQSCAS